MTLSGPAATDPVRRVLVVFLDGVGLGEDDPAVNPLVAADLPVLRRLLEGRAPVAVSAPWSGAAATLVGLDACLDVEGLPQSGTGQAALLTGADAPRLFGRHFGPWTPTALRPLVEQQSFLALALGRGRSVAFANAYPEELLDAAPARRSGTQAQGPLRPEDVPEARPAGAGARGAVPAAPVGGGGPPERPGRPARRRPRVPVPLRIGPVIAARAAGLLTRHTGHLERGEAVASEITNDGWRRGLGRSGVPLLTPAQAGVNLARLCRTHDLTFYAHYATDTVGHTGSLPAGIEAVARVDAFLGGVLGALPGDALLLIVSDHGNLEDVRAGHTRNAALALAAGPGHYALGEASSLRDVAPLVLGALGAVG